MEVINEISSILLLLLPLSVIAIKIFSGSAWPIPIQSHAKKPLHSKLVSLFIIAGVILFVFTNKIGLFVIMTSLLMLSLISGIKYRHIINNMSPVIKQSYYLNNFQILAFIGVIMILIQYL